MNMQSVYNFRVACVLLSYVLFFFFKQKTAYEMRISDWSSDVCSSDLADALAQRRAHGGDMILDMTEDLHGFLAGLTPDQKAAFLERAEHERHFQIGRASCRERVCQYV